MADPVTIGTAAIALATAVVVLLTLIWMPGRSIYFLVMMMLTIMVGMMRNVMRPSTSENRH